MRNIIQCLISYHFIFCIINEIDNNLQNVIFLENLVSVFGHKVVYFELCGYKKSIVTYCTIYSLKTSFHVSLLYLYNIHSVVMPTQNIYSGG